MKKASTLIEIIIVIVIMGILASLSIVNLGPAKEKTADKEASANLKLIQAAEKSYHIDTVINYYASSVIADINQNLMLSLPTGPRRTWDYAVWSTGCARATRNGGNGRSWYLTIDDADNEPNPGAGCP